MKKEDNIFVLSSKDLDLEKIEVKGEPKMFLKTTITTADRDLVGDIVTESCMESMISQLKDRTIKLDFEHEAFRGENLTETEMAKTRIPLGKRVSFERGQKGVDVTWELNPAWKKFDSKGDVVYDIKEVVGNIENKFYDGTSIAYIPTKTKSVNSKDGEETRLLDDVVLLNVALTGNPVNTHATVNEIFMKSLDYLKAKKPKPLRSDPKKEDETEEDEEENEEEIKKCKKPKKSNSIKLTEEVKMSEEKEETQESKEAESKEEASAEPVKDEPKEEVKEESKAPAESESEVKALKEAVEAQGKQIQELKAILEKPQHKAKQEQMSEPETKAIEPLDLIR